MGADKPEVGRPITVPETSFPLLQILAALILVFVALLQKEEGKEESKAPKLNPKEQIKLDRRLKEIDDSEQYALVAMIDGWYPCNHSGRSAFHLLPGEVWKYGTTTKGQFGRYSIKYLAGINVSYVIQYQGTIAECLKEEQRKLFSYPYLPESLARPMKDRLPRPPYNSKMQ
jgi:hypothetical protein